MFDEEGEMELRELLRRILDRTKERILARNIQRTQNDEENGRIHPKHRTISCAQMGSIRLTAKAKQIPFRSLQSTLDLNNDDQHLNPSITN